MFRTVTACQLAPPGTEPSPRGTIMQSFGSNGGPTEGHHRPFAGGGRNAAAGPRRFRLSIFRSALQLRPLVSCSFHGRASWQTVVPYVGAPKIGCSSVGENKPIVSFLNFATEDPLAYRFNYIRTKMELSER